MWTPAQKDMRWTFDITHKDGNHSQPCEARGGAADAALAPAGPASQLYSQEAEVGRGHKTGAALVSL